MEIELVNFWNNLNTKHTSIKFNLIVWKKKYSLQTHLRKKITKPNPSKPLLKKNRPIGIIIYTEDQNIFMN